MPEHLIPEFEVVTIEPQRTAVVRAEVAVADLPSVFDRAFHEVMQVLSEQGLAPAGPPFGFYPRMPAATVEVAAGFPTNGTVAPHGEVSAFELPGGRVVRGMHTGPFDRLEQTYQRLLEWAAVQGLTLAEEMWESYLTDPTAQPDPEQWQTLITWPLQ